MKNRFAKLIRIPLLFGLIISVSFYLFIVNSWRFYLDESELSEFILEIEQSEELPEKFYLFYNVEFEKALENGLSKQKFNSIFSKRQRHSISLWTSSLFLHYNSGKYDEISFFTAHSLALKLENETTKKECLNWVSSKLDFLNQQTGIESASKYCFGKDLLELNDRELASLVIMMKNTSLYNINRRRELIEQKVDILIEKITIVNNESQ